MKNCNKYHEKIIFYDDLSEAEKQTIQAHLESCENCRDDFDKINSILKSLRYGLDSSHLDNERLVRFIIFENFPNEPDYDGEKLSSQEISITRKHLESCHVCNEKYYEMKAEYASLEQYIKESKIPNYQLGQNPAGIEFSGRFSHFIHILAEAWNSFVSYSKPKYILAPAAILAIFLVLILFFPFFKGTEVTYQSLAKLDSKKITYLTRGSDINELQKGISSFNEEKYGASIQMLEQFIVSNPDHPNRAFADYVCGLAYLFQVNNIKGDLQAVHQQYIDDGIQHLQTSLSLSPNLRIQEDAAWFIGKAYLMKGNASKAIEYFEKTKDMRGRNYQKAQRILSEIEKNLISIK